jgi:hypothetical protein
MSISPTPKGQLPSKGDQPHQKLDVHTLEHQLQTQTFECSSAFLRLDSGQSVHTVFERQVNSLDVSDRDNDAKNAAFVDKQICLLNLRHVARHHGINLQQIHPDVFPSNIAASSDKPSIPPHMPKA